MSSPSPVKIGAWGGDGGRPQDISVAPHRLETITIRSGDVVDQLTFTYRDRDSRVQTAGPWGGNGGVENKIILTGSEFVTQVNGTVGPHSNVSELVTSLEFVTNSGKTYGPFGKGGGKPFSIPVLNNGSIVGMFGRSGNLVDAIGFYILPFPAF